jgi:nitrogen regulatory protein P-II 1
VKRVVAIIRPNKLAAVKSALEEAGIRGLTLSEVHGYGQENGPLEIFHGNESRIAMVPKTRIEIVATEDQAARFIQVIQTQARTGRIGDGKIFVVPVGSAYRIRTGETGEDAI